MEDNSISIEILINGMTDAETKELRLIAADDGTMTVGYLWVMGGDAHAIFHSKTLGEEELRTKALIFIEQAKKEQVRTLTGRSYMPSSGTAGEGFINHFCAHCVHEKFWHTQKDGDKICPILTATLVEDSVPEWVYDEEEDPTCTKHEPWEWNITEENPEGTAPPVPTDPNQTFLFPVLETRYDEESGFTCAYIPGYRDHGTLVWANSAGIGRKQFKEAIPRRLGDKWRHDTGGPELEITKELIDNL